MTASAESRQPVIAAPASLPAIDVHTHVVPQTLPGYAGRLADAPWPSIAPADACHRHVVVSGSIYRTVSHQCWRSDVRLADMDNRDIAMQVLSPMPELLSYWLAPEDGAALCRYLNETIAAMVHEQPDRFAGLAAVPLQDVASAIAELDIAVNRLGLAGVEIGGNINGEVIGHPRFLPFFEAAVAWNAAIFVHPLRPTGLDRLLGPPALEQVLAFPGETGLAAASMITGGTVARLPQLRIAFSHGGGTLNALLPRLQHAWRHLPGLRGSLPIEPAVAARSMYYDDLVYDTSMIRRLVDVFGASQIMVGSDYPFAIMDADPAGRLASLDLPTDVLAQLRSQNAQRWLALPGAMTR
ncbi:MAG: aminocarboxymuconate-semialdehyde decarboxylase [Bordetella sp. SCN 67-23]|nr:MAG: aminocarboxymuconate-semialdehyde decarboxylase [Bordetella sp. SCN 67-23]